MEQLSGQDASFLYFETPRSHMHVASLALYDQATAPRKLVRFRDITENIRKRLHLAKCFRRKLVQPPFLMDHPYWIEDRDFDLEFHIRHIALPPPGDWTQLTRQSARLHSFPLDRTRPLWELIVISGLKEIPGLPPSAFALLLKIHHAAIDGASGAALTEIIHDQQPKPSNIPLPTKPWAGEEEPSAFELAMRTVGNNVLQPFRFADILTRSVPAMRSAATSLPGGGALERLATTTIPRTRFNASVTGHRVMDGREYPLDALRSIKRNVAGATINDVVLTLVGGALRTYLLRYSELPDTPMIAMVPINIRTAEETHTEGNRVAAMTASLGTHIADPGERLAAIRESTYQSKTLTNAIGARLMTDYAQFIPAQLAAQAARLYTTYGMAEQTSPPFNCVVTNVPGPQKPLYMSGARLLRTYGMGPLFDGVGIIFPVLSYDGRITVSFTSCREMLPDPEQLADDLDTSFQELESIGG